MYTAHFGLTSAPFSITPDPQYLYLSECHREALAHLLYGVTEGSGFVLLTGEVGTGKTTLCHCLVNQLPSTADVAFLSNPQVSPLELLATLFDELRLHYDKGYTLKDFIDALHAYLLTAHAVGRQTVLILDEAQNLAPEVLEQVRLLTNLETTHRRLLQIILVGQPEFQKIIKRKSLRQLAQRITARYHLKPLSWKDTQAYINHRLSVSGVRTPLFTKQAMRQVYRSSHGIPRLINIICDRALLGGFVKGQNPINTGIVHKAIREVRGEGVHGSIMNKLSIAIASVLIFALLIGWLYYPQFFSRPPAEPTVIPFTSNQVNPAPVPTVPPVESVTAPVAKMPLNPENLLTLLQHPATFKDIESAFVTLFRHWNLDYTKLTGKTGCERAETQGLTCLYRVGKWEEIRRYNRPTIIELAIESMPQDRYHVVVTGLQGDKATLNFLGHTFDFPLAEIDKHWLGHFLLLWHPPAVPLPVLNVGSSGENVLWVRKRLDQIEGRLSDATVASPNYDAALKRRIADFQQKQGLGSDGVAGELTLLMLDMLSNEGPLLVKNPR
jgi:general secretion pathway protein A